MAFPRSAEYKRSPKQLCLLQLKREENAVCLWGHVNEINQACKSKEGREFSTLELLAENSTLGISKVFRRTLAVLENKSAFRRRKRRKRANFVAIFVFIYYFSFPRWDVPTRSNHVKLLELILITFDLGDQKVSRNRSKKQFLFVIQTTFLCF